MRALPAPPAVLLAVLLLSGCFGSGGPAAGSPVADPAGSMQPWEVTIPECISWHAVLDAPADTFPDGTPHAPVEGSKPGTVQAVALGVHCGEGGRELWSGWAVAEGGVLPRLVFTDNATRAALYQGAGLPAENVSMSGFYALHGPDMHIDGVGRADRSEVVHLTVATGVPVQAPEPAAFLLPDGNGTVTWAAEGGSGLVGGLAQFGVSAFVDPEHWTGSGARQASTLLRVTWTPVAA